MRSVPFRLHSRVLAHRLRRLPSAERDLAVGFAVPSAPSLKKSPVFVGAFSSKQSFPLGGRRMAVSFLFSGKNRTLLISGKLFAIQHTKINGDTAVVKIKAERGKENSTNDVSLILVDGVWKINKDY